MSRFFGLLALAALLCMSAVSGQVTCGGAGYDLSSLRGQEFSILVGGNTIYSIAPCGVITNRTACPFPNYPDTSFCQTPLGRNGTSLAQYTAANSTWGQSLNGNGVEQEIQDGTFCAAEGGEYGGGPRETKIIYLCDATATTARLLNVTEPHTCFYTAYIATAAACTRTTNSPTGAYSPVNTRYYDTRCGGGAYDLSPLQSVDLFWSPNSSTTTTVWFLRVCGAVSSANCTATNGQQPGGVPSETAMLCQSDQNNPTGNDHGAAYNVPSQQVWTLPSLSGGLRMEIQDGQPCGAFNRETTINFVCNSSATTPVMTGVHEVSVCYYTATVQTNLVCPDRLLIGSSTGSVVPPSGSSSSAAVLPRSSSSSASSVSAQSSASSASSSAAVSRSSSSSSSSSAANTFVTSSSSTIVITPSVTSSSSSSSGVVSPSVTPSSSSSSSTGDVNPPPTQTSGAVSKAASSVVVAGLLAVVALLL